MSSDQFIVGNSAALVEVLRRAERFAGVPRPLLILGERGTGKELLGHYVHARSPVADGPFVAINCAVYRDELLASELFGHEKGAFTGAAAQRAGCLEKARGGTLFFDEVGNMSVRFQENLLRVIESRRFERVGGSKALAADVRFLFATNADLDAMMQRGEFRRDLYDRIAFETLRLPPLRQRREDISLLVQHFTLELVREIPNFASRTFSPEALRQMMAYYWPGNIRELKNVVERLQLQPGGELIGTVDLPQEITASAPLGDSFDAKVEAYKKHLILSAWRDTGMNQKKAADLLGVSYDQFRHYFKKYSLKDLAG